MELKKLEKYLIYHNYCMFSVYS